MFSAFSPIMHKHKCSSIWISLAHSNKILDATKIIRIMVLEMYTHVQKLDGFSFVRELSSHSLA